VLQKGGKGQPMTGYTLKFKKEGGALGSAESNFLRFFFTREELEGKTAQAQTTLKGLRKDSDAVPKNFQKKSQQVANKKTLTAKEVYGVLPDKLVLIYGERSKDYKTVQFKQATIDVAKGREMLVTLYTKKGKTDTMRDFGLGSAEYTSKGQKKTYSVEHILKAILADGVKNGGNLGPKIDFTQIDKVEAQAAQLMNQLNVNIEAISKSLEGFKTLAYTYLQNFKPEIAAASKEKFVTLRTEINKTYETYGSGVQLENKKNEINSLKRLDKLIEQVILYKNTEEK